MTKANNTRSLKTLKTIADNFGKDKRKYEKKIFRLDRFLSKKEEDPVEMLGAGESPMDDHPMENEVDPRT